MSKMRVDTTWRPNIEQTAITSSGSSQQSAAFGDQTRCIRLACSSSTLADGIHYSIGYNPTATANGPLLAGGQYEYVSVSPGEKVAIIDYGGALVCTITEMTH